MTKLLEWLAAVTVIFGVWWSLLNGKIGGNFAIEQPLLVYSLPVIFVGIFGIYAVIVVLYRTFTFNNCEKAAAELQQEIQEAKDDLISKGFVFKHVE